MWSVKHMKDSNKEIEEKKLTLQQLQSVESSTEVEAIKALSGSYSYLLEK